MGPDEYVICADEKTSIQARERKVLTLPPAPGRPALIEHEYIRHGALAYLAALDIRSGRVMSRTEEITGIDPFFCLVNDVMLQEPYASARCVYWWLIMVLLTGLPDLLRNWRGAIRMHSPFTFRSTPVG